MANYERKPVLLFDGVKIISRNFRGIDYNGKNKTNKKTFKINLDPDITDVQELKEQGWNVKELPPRDGHEDEPPRFVLEVEARWDKFPPVIHLVTERVDVPGKYTKTLITDEIGAKVIDTADIIKCKVEVSGYKWEVNGERGIKAYLKRMIVETRADKFEEMLGEYDFGDDDIFDD